MSENEKSLPSPDPSRRLNQNNEGASTFPVKDPLVKLIYNYGSFLPGNETYYGIPEQQLREFIEAVGIAGRLHPELVLQYAAWVRDPVKGKGNRSQPPWVVAVLAGIAECREHPRFVELVAKCIVRPDDALNIIQAASLWLGEKKLPEALKQGVAAGLKAASDYQLAKYANSSLDLRPLKPAKKTKTSLPPGNNTTDTALTQTEPEPEASTGVLTLRLVDVLGICKHQLDQRLFKLYRYLHAPTRMQPQLLPLLEESLPLLIQQKELRANPPHELVEVAPWVEKALAARMTMEQIFAATGLAPRQRVQLLKLQAAQQITIKLPAEDRDEEAEEVEPVETESVDLVHLSDLEEADIKRLAMRAEFWKLLNTARIPDETDPARLLPFLGDMAFMRNIRGMSLAGLPTADLLAEAKRRRFNGLWPFQIVTAAQQIRHGSHRGAYKAPARPEVLPVLDAIFERTTLDLLPRRPDGSYYRILGMADVSGSMATPIGGLKSKATCMDVSLAFTVAFSFTTRGPGFRGLAGTWDNRFHPASSQVGDSALTVFDKVKNTGGWGGGGTQIFSSMIDLINYLVAAPRQPRPEVLVILSDMQFYPPASIDRTLLKNVPQKYQKLIQKPAFAKMPPLAAAIVLYREILDTEVSLVLWNLAAYQGSPVPSGMERVLMLSGFDANSFKTIEAWLRAGSPGSAMPTNPQAPAGSGQSGSSFEAVLANLRRY